MSDLLPCPFCGGTALTVSSHSGGPGPVMCDGCGGHAPTVGKWQERVGRTVHWRGIGKVVEEYGEVLQLLGKLIDFPEGPHPDGLGSIADRLTPELEDALAATNYFQSENAVRRDHVRYADKVTKFFKWKLAGIRR